MLGGEICARPPVQESMKKAVHGVVGEDCSLVILCLRSASSTRFSSAVDSGNDARVPERDDIHLEVALPPLGGIGQATALMVRRGICAMTKAKPQRQKEKPNEARRRHRISTHKALPICCRRFAYGAWLGCRRCRRRHLRSSRPSRPEAEVRQALRSWSEGRTP